jgi:hypothetical protein
LLFWPFFFGVLWPQSSIREVKKLSPPSCNFGCLASKDTPVHVACDIEGKNIISWNMSSVCHSTVPQKNVPRIPEIECNHGAPAITSQQRCAHASIAKDSVYCQILTTWACPIVPTVNGYPQISLSQWISQW